MGEWVVRAGQQRWVSRRLTLGLGGEEVARAGMVQKTLLVRTDFSEEV
jgi:hypothetical protein